MQHSGMLTGLEANLLAAKQEIQHLNHDRNREIGHEKIRGDTRQNINHMPAIETFK